MPSLRKRDSIADEAKLHFSGHLMCQNRHASGLEAVLKDFFRLPVAVLNFIGHWVTLPPEGLCKLGDSPETGTLGLTAVAGSRVWDCQSRFRITIGPVGLADYERMLPGGASLKKLVDWVRLYVGDSLSWDVNLVLRKDEVPALKLGEYGRLGWTTWAGAAARERDPDDLILDPVAHEQPVL
jgi:type VI secretion system protein ImpH